MRLEIGNFQVKRLAFAERTEYRHGVLSINKEEAGIGTLLSGQFVFSLVYMVTLIAMFCVFYFAKLPLGL